MWEIRQNYVGLQAYPQRKSLIQFFLECHPLCKLISLLSLKLLCQRLLFIFLTIFIGLYSQALAQESGGQAQVGEAVVSETAPVIVDGRELFRVGGVSAYPAPERAKTIAERIRALAADKSIDPKNLEVVREGELIYVKSGSRNGPGPG